MAGRIKLQVYEYPDGALSFRPWGCPMLADGDGYAVECVFSAEDQAVRTCPMLFATETIHKGAYARHKGLDALSLDAGVYPQHRDKLYCLCLAAPRDGLRPGARTQGP